MELNFNNFKLLHNHILTILTTNNYEHENLAEKMHQYLQMIVESHKLKQSQDIFDYFCENNGNKIFRILLQVNELLAVQIFSLLFINMKDQLWINYIMCQPYIIHAIEASPADKDQQWSQYYIAFLKALSIRLNSDQLSLFYNKRFCKFPLIYESLKYYNHNDCMVRTNVMNIILGIMKIKNKSLQAYFSSFPFTSYILTFCVQIYFEIKKFNHQLQSPKQISKQQAKMFCVDFSDNIFYLNDLVIYGPQKLKHFIENCVLSYIIYPMLQILRGEYENEIQQGPIENTFLTRNAIYIILTVCKIFRNTKIQQIVCTLLLNQKISTQIFSKLQKGSNPYIPLVYSNTHKPDNYYWDKFQYQLTEHCLTHFKSVDNFQVEHEDKKQNPDLTKQFNEEITKISQFLDFNILTYQEKDSIYQIILSINQRQKFTQSNIIRENLMNLLNFQNKNQQNSISLLKITIQTIHYFMKVDCVSNVTLKKCGILLPRIDTVNYKYEYNLKNLDILNEKLIQLMFDIFKQFKTQSTKQSPQIIIETIKIILNILNESIHARCNQNYELRLKSIYEQITILLRQTMKASFSIYISDVIELFQVTYLLEERNFLSENYECSYKIFQRSKLDLVRANIREKLTKNFSVQQNYKKQNQETKSQNLQSQQKLQQSKQEQQSIVSQPNVNFVQIANKDQKIQGKKLKRIQTQIVVQKAIQREQNVISKKITQKQMMLYCISLFAIYRTFYCKYMETFKYEKFDKLSTIFYQKFNKIQDQLKINHSYIFGFTHMIQTFIDRPLPKTKNKKNLIKIILIENTKNFLVVEPSSENNKAKILINHPWKYVFPQILPSNANLLNILLKNCQNGNQRISLQFQNNIRSQNTLKWINKMKKGRFQQEFAFLLNFTKKALNQ